MSIHDLALSTNILMVPNYSRPSMWMKLQIMCIEINLRKHQCSQQQLSLPVSTQTSSLPFQIYFFNITLKFMILTYAWMFSCGKKVITYLKPTIKVMVMKSKKYQSNCSGYICAHSPTTSHEPCLLKIHPSHDAPNMFYWSFVINTTFKCVDLFMLGLGSEAIRMHSCTTNLLQAMQE